MVEADGVNQQLAQEHVQDIGAEPVVILFLQGHNDFLQLGLIQRAGQFARQQEGGNISESRHRG